MNIQHQFQQEIYLEGAVKRFLASKINDNLSIHISDLLSGREEFQPQNFKTYSLREVFNYLKVSHDYYLNKCIPQLENTLVQLIKKSTVSSRTTQLYFLLLNNYKNELIDHIEKEERILFSYVEDMLEDRNQTEADTYAINYFLNAHNDNVVLEIDQLKSDMLKQNTELANEFSFEILFRQLEFLQRDLAIHALIEDHVFIPLVLEAI